MKTLAERLTTARTEKKLTQEDLARAAGVSQGTIGNVEAGIRGTPRKIAAIADALGVRALWLAEGKGPMSDDDSPNEAPGTMRTYVAGKRDAAYVQIPMVTLQLQAGVTGYQTEPDRRDGGTLGVRRDWVERSGFRPESLIAITVRGDSMETALYNGDLVVINTADRKPVDGIVFAVNYEGEAVVKRLSRDAGEWWLRSDNVDQRKYHKKLCKGDACIIIGRIVRKESDRI